MSRGTCLILAFDTSAGHCAAALLRGNAVVASREESMTRGQAERLFPLLTETLAAAKAGWHDLEAIGVGIGPGNFTGIRISVSAARGLALSLGIPAVGVSTLEAAAFGQPEPVLALVEARRDQVYAQRFPGGTPALVSRSGLATDEPVCGPGAAGISESAFRAPTCSIAEAIARIAAARAGPDTPAPAPLYLRDADAKPPSDPAPVLIDDA